MKKRVLHISVHMGGGIGNALSSLVCADRNNEHTIILLQKPQKTVYVEKCINNGVNVSVLSKDVLIEDILKEADVVVIHWWNHPLMIGFLANFPTIRVRSILWCHVSGVSYPYFPPMFLNLFSYVLFTSKYSFDNPHWSLEEKEEIVKKSDLVYGMGPLRCHKQKKKYGIRNIVRIGYMGTLGRSKIHPQFVLACKEIVDTNPNVQFVVLGDIDEADWIKREACRFGIERNYSFEGYVDNVDDYLLSFDIFGYPLNPNNYATTENALLEAMSVGLPVVALNQGTEKYIIDNGVNGVLCDEIGGYSKEILSLIYNEDERRRLGECAKKGVGVKFNFEKNVSKFDAVLETVIHFEKSFIRVCSVMGDTPYKWFLSSLNNVDRKTIELGNLKDLGYIFCEKSKGSVYQFVECFPDDENLKDLAERMKVLYE